MTRRCSRGSPMPFTADRWAAIPSRDAPNERRGLGSDPLADLVPGARRRRAVIAPGAATDRPGSPAASTSTRRTSWPTSAGGPSSWTGRTRALPPPNRSWPRPRGVRSGSLGRALPSWPPMDPAGRPASGTRRRSPCASPSSRSSRPGTPSAPSTRRSPREDQARAVHWIGDIAANAFTIVPDRGMAGGGRIPARMTANGDEIGIDDRYRHVCRIQSYLTTTAIGPSLRREVSHVQP